MRVNGQMERDGEDGAELSRNSEGDAGGREPSGIPGQTNQTWRWRLLHAPGPLVLTMFFDCAVHVSGSFIFIVLNTMISLSIHQLMNICGLFLGLGYYERSCYQYSHTVFL